MQSVRCVVIGDQGVGKTSLLVTYRTKAFPETYTLTAFDTCTTNVLVDDTPVKLELLDTAVEDYERPRLVTYYTTDVFLICFSLVSPMSFYNAWAKWYAEVRYYCPSTPIVIVGTKLDLREELEQIKERRPPSISHAQGTRMIESRKSVKYVECSAMTLKGLENVFEEVVRSALERQTSREEKKGKGSIL